MNIFLISPVRVINDDMLKRVQTIVENYEQNNNVYWPYRDTDQSDDPTGLRICSDNLKAMQNSGIVMICYDGTSQGSLFDLGMAFALGKRIVPVLGMFPNPDDKGKSFHNVVWDKFTKDYNHVEY